MGFARMGDGSRSGPLSAWRLALGAGALAVLPGCGAIAEAALEQVAEEATGVEIEQGDGTVSFEGKDVSVVVDTDAETGTINLTSEGIEGEEDQELTFTARAEVPTDFPVPFPDGGSVESGSTFESGDSKLMHVEVRYPGSDVNGLVSYYEDYFAGDRNMAKHDVSSDGERTVGFVTNPDGDLTAVTIVDQGTGALLYIQTTVGVD